VKDYRYKDRKLHLGPVELDFSSPLIFVRHGSTAWNQAGRYQGSTDIALSPDGEQDARQNAQLIKDLITNGGLDANALSIVASPLLRARQSAVAIADCLEPVPSITIEPALRELSMGRWEGLTSQQVKDRFYEERKSRKSDRWNFKPDGGESMEERCASIAAALARLKPNTVIVTHAVVLRIISHLLGGLEREHAAVFETPHVTILCWNSAKLHRQAQIR